jgi:ribosomal protein S18 acetylase RimI-like enzyme
MNRTVAASEQSTQPIDVRIRTACLDDAARIAELAAQLGYAVTPEDMRSRLETVLGDEHQLVSVAENQHNEIIGWLHLTIARPLLAEPAANIVGLVVDQRFRCHGIGRLLMCEAEAWTLAQDLKWISLRSNVVRNEAHKFYERLGYERVKTQHTYRKHLVS